MNWLKGLWNDESGTVLTAEAVMIGTLGVVGVTVGAHTVTTAVNEEMTDVASAIRSLDQSYGFTGFSGCGAKTAGSSFIQQDVDESLDELCALQEELPPGFKDSNDDQEDDKRRNDNDDRRKKDDDDRRKNDRKERD